MSVANSASNVYWGNGEDRRLFASMVGRIGALKEATGWAEGDDTSEIRQTRTWGSGRCLEKSLKRSSFLVFEFSLRGEIRVRPSQKTRSGKVPKNCNSEINSWRPVINSTQSRSQMEILGTCGYSESL